MTRRQSSRSKGSINYAKFGDGDNESDDDFADNTPPPKKKMKYRKEIKESVKIQRLPEKAEKKFEEEIQKALEISLSASQKEGQSNSNPVEDKNSSKSFAKVESSDTNTNVASIAKQSEAPCSRFDDAAELKESSRKKRKVDSDDDFQVSDASMSDSDQESPSPSDDEDSDNSFSKSKSKRKAAPASKQKQAPKIPVKNATALKTKTLPSKVLKERTNVSKKPKVIPKPTAMGVKSSPMSTLPQRKWTPPGRAGSTASRDALALKSPSSLRIGLSRNVRLKPLHPAAATKT